ncbi:hypothetical protein E4631_23460 [Hymenobacter sp. UV11]|uniref:hypothetical protein n=1 Tax=Hymenobacter sp. UV11 TaxID=1849735 RepID=UPI00105F0271|nr:hypothetical protein [Hymenobacter sp. UV11]TDN39878.1 hypothetical protein A8B98_16610 [Hymenobacter sp. UV11]TFZ63265.1 hypothetical protein E4631_23460 [Hymenobacter sp. UV11]
MKATATTRPARRIPAARLERMRAKAAAAAEAREAAFQAHQDALAQLVSPTPEFEKVARLTMLPGGLHWSAERPVPAVDTRVEVVQGGKQDLVKVLGYCHAGGFIGLVTEPYHPGSKRAHKMHPRAKCVFSHQLIKKAA